MTFVHTPVPASAQSSNSTALAAADTDEKLPTRKVALDIFERVVVGVVFGNFAIQMLRSYTLSGDLVKLLLVFSEMLPFLLIFLRKASITLSEKPGDWIFGMMGFLAPLLLVPVAAGPLVPGNLCLAVVVAGMYVQISAKVILGRGFGIVAANRGVRVAGPYRFVRHPMYAGYTITHIGSLLAMPSLFNLGIYAGALCFQIVRIQREEAILVRDPSYRDYAARVRYRLLPGVF